MRVTMHRSSARLAALGAAMLLIAATASAGSLVSTPDVIAAAKSGDTDLARNALLRGDDPDVIDDDGNTALLYAIKSDHIAVATLLLDGHAAPNRPGRDGKSPLWWAASSGNTDAIAALVKAGAKIDNGAKDGVTPLMAAAAAGHDDAVALLLADGAEVDRTDYSGRDALGWAADSRNAHVIAILKAAEKKS